MTRRRKQWGILFSHAHDWEVDGPYDDIRDAMEWASKVIRAQPGIEHVLVSRPGPGHPWGYGRDRLSPREIGQRKWGT